MIPQRGAIAFRLVLVLLLLGGSAIPRAAAQNSEVTVGIQTQSSTYVGSPTPVSIVVRGSTDSPTPEFPRSDAYTVSYRGPHTVTSQSFRLVNGRPESITSIILTHEFQVTPSRRGQITIPPISVEVNGQTHQTREFTLNVIEPRQSGDYSLDFAPAKNRAYVGEPVPLRLTWIQRKPTRESRLLLPDLPENVEIVPAADPRPPGTPSSDPRFPPFSLGGAEAFGTVTSRMIDGEMATVVEAQWYLVPRSAGTLEFGAARADFDAVVGQRPRRFGDFPFDDLAITERQTAVAPGFSIEAVPLPESGRPGDFSGLVGKFAVATAVDPSTVAVGEPFQLAVQIQTDGPTALIPPLDLRAQVGLPERFRVPRDPLLPSQRGTNSVRFVENIRARTADITAFPSLVVNYFNPETGTYELARSSPIPMVVTPSATVGLADEDENAADDSTRTADLAAAALRRPHAWDFNGTNFDLRTAATNPWFILTAAAGIVLTVVTMAVRFVLGRRERHEPMRRRRKAIGTARRALSRAAGVDRGDVAGIVAATFTNLAADWFNRPRPTMTSDEALQLLASEPSFESDRLASLLRESDRLRFDKTNSSVPAELHARALDVLREVATALRATAPKSEEKNVRPAPLPWAAATILLVIVLVPRAAIAEQKPSDRERWVERATSAVTTVAEAASGGGPADVDDLRAAIVELDAIIASSPANDTDLARLYEARAAAYSALDDHPRALLDALRSAARAPSRLALLRIEAERRAVRDRSSVQDELGLTPAQWVQLGVRSVAPEMRWWSGAALFTIGWVPMLWFAGRRPVGKPAWSLSIASWTVGLAAIGSVIVEERSWRGHHSAVVVADGGVPRQGPDALTFEPASVAGTRLLPPGTELTVLQVQTAAGHPEFPVWIQARVAREDRDEPFWCPATAVGLVSAR